MDEQTRLTWTVEEAAKLLGIGRNSCYEGIRRKEIPSIRIGQRLLIPRHALEALIGKPNESKAPGEPEDTQWHTYYMKGR